MKKLIGLGIAMMLSLSIVGCSSTEEQEAPEQTKEKIEQPVEEPEQEEIIEEQTITIENNEEFNKYITGSFTDEEFYSYFDSIKLQEIEFDATVIFIQQREGYDTRFAMLLTPGDDINVVMGPNIYVDDIAGTDITKENLYETAKVRVKCSVSDYNLDAGYLEVDFAKITSR